MTAPGAKRKHSELETVPVPVPEIPSIPVPEETQSAIPGIPDDVVIRHVFGRIKDPTDMARLRAVSQAMRAGVKETGRKIREITGEAVVRRGYVTTLAHLHATGRLVFTKDLPHEGKALSHVPPP
jgi:hypothetical protein